MLYAHFVQKNLSCTIERMYTHVRAHAGHRTSPNVNMQSQATARKARTYMSCVCTVGMTCPGDPAISSLSPHTCMLTEVEPRQLQHIKGATSDSRSRKVPFRQQSVRQLDLSHVSQTINEACLCVHPVTVGNTRLPKEVHHRWRIHPSQPSETWSPVNCMTHRPVESRRSEALSAWEPQ